MTDTESLKPCPFCGGAPTLHLPQTLDNLNAWACETIDCPCGPATDLLPPDQATAAWNTRPPLRGELKGSSRDHALPPEAGQGNPTLAAPCPELPEGSLYPSGFMPYWTVARDTEQAIYGLCYILQQIQATNTYRPNIGQVSAAMSSLEYAIRALRDGMGRAPCPPVIDGDKSRDEQSSPLQGEAVAWREEDKEFRSLLWKLDRHILKGGMTKLATVPLADLQQLRAALSKGGE